MKGWKGVTLRDEKVKSEISFRTKYRYLICKLGKTEINVPEVFEKCSVFTRTINTRNIM